VLDPRATPMPIASDIDSSVRPSTVVGLIRETRPKQWSKNLLLFFGLIFALKLSDPNLVARAAAGFAVFCLASSGVYLFNDLADVERDRMHPTKKFRPLAAGVISPAQAIALGVILFVVALVAAFSLGLTFGLLTLLYIALTSAYSARLKHVVLVDAFVLAAGFVIRAAAGAVVIGVPISPWLYVCTILASLFLALGKRRSELVLLNAGAGHHRRILDEYSLPLLDQLIVVVTSAMVMAYSLYTFSAENLPIDHSMMLTLPFVLYGLFRYMYLMHQRNGGGSPEEALLGDRPLLASAVLWILSAVVILYGARLFGA
jgi:4-hydroxybenzoate polyprenyltransferase